MRFIKIGYCLDLAILPTPPGAPGKMKYVCHFKLPCTSFHWKELSDYWLLFFLYQKKVCDVILLYIWIKLSISFIWLAQSSVHFPSPKNSKPQSSILPSWPEFCFPEFFCTSVAFNPTLCNPISQINIHLLKLFMSASKHTKMHAHIYVSWLLIHQYS